MLGARTLSTSGRQLFTIDEFRDTGKPLLEILADPNSIFIKGLARFERRTLYANIVNDRSAVFYTTGISRTDPYTDLTKIKLNYLKGFDNVILDPDTPIEPHEIVQDLTFSARAREFSSRLPLLLAFVIFIPIGVTAFLVNSGIQSYRSTRRIRLHEQGLAGIQASNYRVPLLIEEMQGAVEGVYENLNSAQENEYLTEGSEEMDSDAGSGSTATKAPKRPHSKSSLSRADDPEKSRPAVPTLALAPYQFKMIRTLDEVGFRKYPVHIHKVGHSHAAIISRRDKESYNEGHIVFRHWLDEEFII